MIKIGICDDNTLYIEQFTKMLKKIETSHDLTFKLTTFTSGEQLVSFCEDNPNYFNIIFLDILMTGINGIETARSIRSLNYNEFIVFLTSSREYALDGYSVNAYSYILKPFSYVSIEKIVLELNSKVTTSKKNTIVVKNNQDLVTLQLDNIVYFESNLRKVTARFFNGDDFAFYNKMSELEESIDCSYFVRCHRSFLINLNYLKSIIGLEILTTTGESIPISKKYLSETKDAFTDFIVNKMSD